MQMFEARTSTGPERNLQVARKVVLEEVIQMCMVMLLAGFEVRF